MNSDPTAFDEATPWYDTENRKWMLWDPSEGNSTALGLRPFFVHEDILVSAMIDKLHL